MNEDLEFIQSVIKEEIKTWAGYRRELVDDVGEEEFIKEMGIEIFETLEDGNFLNSKSAVLDYLYDLTIDYDET